MKPIYFINNWHGAGYNKITLVYASVMHVAGSKILSVMVQQRDVTLLNDLKKHGMTMEQCVEFHFEGRKEAARKRIKALIAAGLVQEGKSAAGRTFVTTMPKAREVPSLKKPTDAFPRGAFPNSVDHYLQIQDVKVAFHRAARTSAFFDVLEFGTSPHRHWFLSAQGRGNVFPDGFIRLKAKAAGEAPTNATSFFLELDRSTETVGTLVDKAREYLAFYLSGGFARRNGSPGHRYRRYPFRLLVILKSPERRNNLAAALSRLPRPILTLAWLATLADVRRDPAAAIWLTPAAYREAVRETRFADFPVQKPYRTDPAREQLVEERAERRRLL